MTVNSDKNYHKSSTEQDKSLFSFGSGRLRFCITVVITIFIVETILMIGISLLPPMPGIITALLDSLLLVFIIFLIFWPQLKKEMTFQNARIVETQETLRKSEERYRALVESTGDSIYLVNREYCYVFMNQNHLARLGYSAEEFFGRPYSEFHSEDETRKFEAAVDEVFAMGKSIQQEHQSDRDNLYFLRTLSPVKEKNGIISAVMIISKQITEQKKMEEELRKLSLTDELTGLYNRRGFMTLAAQQIKIANRLKRQLLLTLTDLDDLKVINDTMGHKEGDQALIDVASILLKTFRSSDIVARIGGDEFVTLQIKNPDELHLSNSTDRLQETLANHNSQSGKSYILSLSLGSVLYNPADAKSLEQLLAEADEMMYEQKKSKIHSKKD
jgi:diguanylate cyclase (GGDEF)-like protein/PAS domain S-box-containing protein